MLVIALAIISIIQVVCADNNVDTEQVMSASDMASSPGFNTGLTTTMDTIYQGHKKPCSKEEEKKARCFEGQCFVIQMNGNLPGCICDDGWSGARCELKEIPPELWGASAVAGLVAALVMVIGGIAALIGFFLWRRHKRRRLHETRNISYHTSNSHGSAAVPLKEDQEDTHLSLGV